MTGTEKYLGIARAHALTAVLECSSIISHMVVLEGFSELLKRLGSKWHSKVVKGMHLPEAIKEEFQLIVQTQDFLRGPKVGEVMTTGLVVMLIIFGLKAEPSSFRET